MTPSEALTLARAYYAKPGNECGGNLHIVLDDGNLDNDDVRFCYTRALAACDADGSALALALFLLDDDAREYVYTELHRKRTNRP